MEAELEACLATTLGKRRESDLGRTIGLSWSSPGKMGTAGPRELAEKFVAQAYYAGRYYEESLLNVDFR